jgi:G3E family GTPase
MQQTTKRVPANLITGFLGSGKTTAIRALLDTRPAGERWSILINEFGTVSIDQTDFDAGDAEVKVQELAGGCMCCTMSAIMAPLLARFLHQTRPDRLIIEPSGLGHPAQLIDQLRGPDFRQLVDLRATVCLVDPQNFENPLLAESAVFHDQIQMADVVALNWTDRRNRETIDRCRAWIEQFDPPKLLVTETSFGRLDHPCLDRDATLVRPPRFGDAHEPQRREAADRHPGHHAHHEPLTQIERSPQPGKPLRFENAGQGQWACGWIFSPEDVFDRDVLLDLLGYLRPVLRLKGVFHCDDDWWKIQRVGNETSFRPSVYRHDSRLEIIIPYKTNGWLELETKLLACLRLPSRE